MKRFFAVLFLILAFSSTAAFAKSLKIGPGDKILTPEEEAKRSAAWAKVENYGQKTLDKFDYGMINFFTGWTTLVSEPMRHSKNAAQDENKFAAGLKGFGEGLVLFPVDTVGGALNALTFPIAVKVPLPKDGVDLTQLTGNNIFYSAKPEE